MRRNERGKKHVRIMADALWRLQEAVATFPPEVRELMLQDLENLDGQNCWFWEKDMADAMRSILLYVDTEDRRLRNRASETLRKII